MARTRTTIAAHSGGAGGRWESPTATSLSELGSVCNSLRYRSGTRLNVPARGEVSVDRYRSVSPALSDRYAGARICRSSEKRGNRHAAGRREVDTGKRPSASVTAARGARGYG